MDDIYGTSLIVCMHRILMEENVKNSIKRHRRLNDIKKELMKNEIIKWLDDRILYLISRSVWVNPIQRVPKKSGMKVIENEKNSHEICYWLEDMYVL